MAKNGKTKPRVISHAGSVLDSMYNLRCENGHFHFSPEPYSFVGSECGLKSMTGSGICRKKLEFIRDSRSIPDRKPKHKKIKAKRI